MLSNIFDCHLADLPSLFDTVSKHNGEKYLCQVHRIIYQICKFYDNKDIKYAEIGSRIGNSASCAALGNPNAQIFCFDFPVNIWGGFKGSDTTLKENLNFFAPDRNNIFLGDSHSGEIISAIKDNSPYDIFLVDGDHSYQGAKLDLKLSFESLNNNGYIILDDLILHPELEVLFDEFVKENELESLKIMDSIPEESNMFHKRGVGIIKKSV